MPSNSDLSRRALIEAVEAQAAPFLEQHRKIANRLEAVLKGVFPKQATRHKVLPLVPVLAFHILGYLCDPAPIVLPDSKTAAKQRAKHLQSLNDAAALLKSLLLDVEKHAPGFSATCCLEGTEPIGPEIAAKSFDKYQACLVADLERLQRLIAIWNNATRKPKKMGRKPKINWLADQTLNDAIAFKKIKPSDAPGSILVQLLQATLDVAKESSNDRIDIEDAANYVNKFMKRKDRGQLFLTPMNPFTLPDAKIGKLASRRR